MSSTNGGPLGRICRAIDEFAGASASAEDATTGPAAAAGDQTARVGSASRASRDPDIARLAAIWEMVADADPELAKRLPGYLSAAE